MATRAVQIKETAGLVRSIWIVPSTTVLTSIRRSSEAAVPCTRTATKQPSSASGPHSDEEPIGERCVLGSHLSAAARRRQQWVELAKATTGGIAQAAVHDKRLALSRFGTHFQNEQRTCRPADHAGDRDCSTHVALEQIVLRATHQPSIGLGHQVQVRNAPRRVVEAQSSRNIRLIRALPRGSSRTVKTSLGWAEIHLFAHAILVGAAQHFLAAVGRRLESRKLARMLTLFHGRGYNSTSIHRPIFGRSVEAQSFC